MYIMTLQYVRQCNIFYIFRLEIKKAIVIIIYKYEEH